MAICKRLSFSNANLGLILRPAYESLVVFLVEQQLAPFLCRKPPTLKSVLSSSDLLWHTEMSEKWCSLRLSDLHITPIWDRIMLSDLTPTSLSGSVLASLPLSSLCCVCVCICVCLQAGCLCTCKLTDSALIRPEPRGQHTGPPLQLSVHRCTYMRGSFLCTRSVMQTSQRHSEMMWDRERKTQSERSLWCAQPFFCVRISNGSEGVWERRSEDDWLTLQTWSILRGSMRKNTRANSSPHFLPGFRPADRHLQPLALKLSTLLRWLAVFTYTASVFVGDREKERWYLERF